MQKPSFECRVFLKDKLCKMKLVGQMNFCVVILFTMGYSGSVKNVKTPRYCTTQLVNTVFF